MSPVSKSSVLVAAAGVAVNRALLRMGLRRRGDGWRRAAGLVLRGECSTFVLSAFGLDAWSDVGGGRRGGLAESRAHAVRRLLAFLDGEPCCHVGVLRGGDEDRAVACDGVCLSLTCQPWVDGPERFVAPEDWSGEPYGFGPGTESVPLMNVVLRVGDAGQTDVWLRVNHVGADGVPIQEMLSRLESAWGSAGDVVYPTFAEFAPVARVRPLPDRPGLGETQAFIDFSPLLTWRKRENARLAEPLTVGAALLWCLARHDAFRGLHMGTTVEVAPSGGIGRGVGVVVTRPSDLFQSLGGLAVYAAGFNREMERTRKRRTSACATLDAAALIPAHRAKALLCHALDHAPGSFGTFALTMLKDARVFGTPLAEAGHRDGFVAVGSLGLPAGDGSRVGCVTIKGPIERVGRYPDFIREALDGLAPSGPQ
jgi:hypothetical protein